MATDWRSLVGAKSVEQLVHQAFTRLRDAGSAITNLNVGGVMRTLLELCAQGLADLYDLLAAVVAQGYVGSATGQWLDARAADLGLTRLAAKRTEGLVRFHREGIQGNALIAAGVIVSTQTSTQGDRLRFFVTSDTLLPDGADEVYVPVRAEAAGARYNVAPGLITELVTHVEGVDGVVNDIPPGADTWITSVGTDDESDDHLRQRCLLRWYELTRGATKHAYIAWAMSVPGVTDVAVHDYFPRGPGTVDVVITGPSGVPSDELIAQVQAFIEDRRPICSDVLVRPPRLVHRDIRLTAYIPMDAGDIERTRAQILDRLNSLVATGHRPEAPRLRIGQWPYRARLVALALSAPDVFTVLIQSPTQDEDLDVDELFVADLVEVEVERAEP